MPPCQLPLLIETLEKLAMTIDTSGKWWKGEDFNDVAEYVKALTENGYPATEVVQAVCICGHTVFRLFADQYEGCAQKVCAKCGAAAFICDSEDCWGVAKPKSVRCGCKNDTFEVGAGFAFRERRSDVDWITVAHRCAKCGVLASSVDWKISFSPSLHLLTLV